MQYSHNYSKLQKKFYTTIRKHKKGEVGDIKKEIYPNGTHYSKIIKVERKTLDDIPTDILLKDTDQETREQAYELFLSFYDNIDFKHTLFYVYSMKKMRYLDKFYT